MRTLIVSLIAIPLLMLSARAAAGAAHDYRVVFPDRIGPYLIGGNRYATYAEAKRAFGKPSYRRPRSAAICSVTWEKEGLRLQFRSPSSKPCSRRGLADAAYAGAAILSRRWKVDRGLRVRDPASKIEKLYPSAGKRLHGEQNLTRRMVAKPHTNYIRGAYLDVTIRYGRIAKFDLYYDG